MALPQHAEFNLYIKALKSKLPKPPQGILFYSSMQIFQVKLNSDGSGSTRTYITSGDACESIELFPPLNKHCVEYLILYFASVNFDKNIATKIKNTSLLNDENLDKYLDKLMTATDLTNCLEITYIDKSMGEVMRFEKEYILKIYHA